MSMKSIKLVRTLREGVRNFYRDKWLTIATVVIMSLALYLVGIAVFLGFGVLQVIDTVESRVNVSMYFDFTVSEAKILEIKEDLENRSIEQIQSVSYISRDQALNDFLVREGESEEIKEALNMIGDNPLPASLVIVAFDTIDYDKINTFLYQEYGEYILETNHEQNKAVIDEIHSVIVFVRNSGIVLGVLFAIIAVLVTLNTIRMSLYAHRNEFEIMRLVGASNIYVKLPTLVEGLLYGLASGIISSIFLIISVLISDPLAKKLIENIDISAFYAQSILIVVCVMILLGMILGFCSSYIGVRRYLER
jgi:cell division transport system permease protein